MFVSEAHKEATRRATTIKEKTNAANLLIAKQKLFERGSHFKVYSACGNYLIDIDDCEAIERIRKIIESKIKQLEGELASLL